MHNFFPSVYDPPRIVGCVTCRHHRSQRLDRVLISTAKSLHAEADKFRIEFCCPGEVLLVDRLDACKSMSNQKNLFWFLEQ